MLATDSALTVSAIQMPCSWQLQDNIDLAIDLISQAKKQGAQIVLLPELFAAPYFCIDERNSSHFALATEYPTSPLIQTFSELARELGVVLPLSYFESAQDGYFNSLCVIDADGRVLENYRKSHIPEGAGYDEKNYFSAGNTGFKVWTTAFGVIGAAICWDQWFPEAARAMALMGAECLFYPTAIGSEPLEPEIDSAGHWQRVMQGHSAANLMPVIAANRFGVERGDQYEIEFYGSSFITDHTGFKIKEAGRRDISVLLHTFDRQATRAARESWGLFRDRRPDLYGPVASAST